jgi:hypothetical protein
MRVGSLDPAAMVRRALEYASTNLTIERLLIRFGIDPGNVTYEAIFNRLLDLALANITFANVLALVGGIFLILSFVARTIVRMRVLCIVSIVFLLGAAALSGSVPKFLMYFLALPANVVRLVQIRNLVKKARSSEQGTLSLDWLRPFAKYGAWKTRYPHIRCGPKRGFSFFRQEGPCLDRIEHNPSIHDLLMSHCLNNLVVEGFRTAHIWQRR